MKSDLISASNLPVGIRIDDMGADIIVSSEPAAALDSGMVMIPANADIVVVTITTVNPATSSGDQSISIAIVG